MYKLLRMNPYLDDKNK